MEIKLLGWGYENIRRINTLELNLLQHDTTPPHISLIMMRNGTGKTTTITLIRAILSGAAVSWSPERVREFQPTHGQATSGKFYVKMRFGTELYHYNLLLDYEQGAALYQTSRVGMTGGLELGRTLPMQLKGVFDNEEFINRFVFDGEQARKTLSSGNREAEMAVTYLYQINELDNLISKIRELVERKQVSSPGATSRSVSNNRTRMENKKKTLDILKSRRDTISERISQIEDNIETKENRRKELIASDDRLRKEQDRLESEQIRKKEELKQIFLSIENKIVEPFQVHRVFDERLQDLTQNLQTLKLPKTTAREFFKELSESVECICGRPIGAQEKESILSRAENYLGEEDLGAINAIKDKLRHYQPTDELKQTIEIMVKLKEELREIKGGLDRLALRLGGKANQEVAIIDNELKDLARELSDLKGDLSILIAPIGTPTVSDQNNIGMAQKAWEEARNNYLQATGTYEFTQKAEKTISYIEAIRFLALDKLKATIIQKTNEKVEKIITDDKITIDKIDGNLVLHDRKAVSEGQTLAIAYAYIGSLFEHSSFEFPFVVDSPAASMDLGVRREVASIIPRLFKQLVIFVTSGEVAGFAEKFYGLDNVLYATIEGNDDDEKASCTFGKEYFSTYQCEE